MYFAIHLFSKMSYKTQNKEIEDQTMYSLIAAFACSSRLYANGLDFIMHRCYLLFTLNPIHFVEMSTSQICDAFIFIR